MKNKAVKMTMFLVLGICLTGNAEPPVKKSKAPSRMEDKVLVCHQTGNSGNTVSILVSTSALAAHLAHGDQLGSCDQPQDPCAECAANLQICMDNAWGDAALMKQCNSTYNACLSENNCVVVPPAPEPAPGPGK
jgi:hypothetical protein